MSLFKTFFIVLMSLSLTGMAQVVNQYSIIPSNPDDNDTVYLALDFSYTGNCTFGLVYSNVSMSGDTVFAMPTYCGHFDTTQCQSLDTITLGIFPAGQYELRIEIHQGSVCPISGFDAIIAQVNTSLTVSEVTALESIPANENGLTLFPNPAKNSISVQLNNPEKDVTYRILNSKGQLIRTGVIEAALHSIDIAELKSGIYLMEVNRKDEVLSEEFVVQ